MLSIREKDGTMLTISDCAPGNKRLLTPNNLGRTEAGPAVDAQDSPIYEFNKN